MILPAGANWFRKSWPLWALVLVSALIVLGALMLAGANPGKALWDLLEKSLGSADSLTGTLAEVTPLLICGIAVFLALKAGLFNIGVEGQFTTGALAAAVVTLRVPGFLGIVLAILAGMVTGGIWALPAAAIKAYRGGHEVITTIMLNNVAVLLTTALVAGPLKAPTEESPMTTQIAASSYLPDAINRGGLQISAGLPIGLLLALGLWMWLRRSVAGYELQATGANARAAQFAGINHRRVIMKSMVWSGAFGGLAGAIQVLSFKHNFIPGLASGYGFDALGVALLAGNTPLGLLPSAALFGILNKGGTSIQIIDQVPKGITSVILGLLIVIAASIRYRKMAVSSA
ncbi:MAG: ABC transporter permease [Fimbriimonadales bacterium]